MLEASLIAMINGIGSFVIHFLPLVLIFNLDFLFSLYLFKRYSVFFIVSLVILQFIFYSLSIEVERSVKKYSLLLILTES